MATAVNSTSLAEIRRGRTRAFLREALLGWLFVAPATLITVVFALYPVISGFFISMQGGSVIPEGFIGLANYFTLMGSIAYVVVLAIAVALIFGAYRLYAPLRARMGSNRGGYWYLLPGTLGAVGLILMMLVAFWGLNDYAWGPILLIALAVALFIVIERRERAGFVFIINSLALMLLTLAGVLLILFTFSQINLSVSSYLDALPQTVSTNKYVVPLDSQFVAILGLAAAFAGVVAIRSTRSKIDTVQHPGRNLLLSIVQTILVILAILFTLYLLAALDLLRVTLSVIRPEKLATVTSLKQDAFVARIMSWPEVFTILLGIALVGAAFWFWTSAVKRRSSFGAFGMFGLALLLMVGGWLLISELPDAISGGDPNFYHSLLNTFGYTIMTVPLQLGLGLLLAYLLFYEVTAGKSFYRVVFFIPYIAPIVATATVFSVIFSLDPSAPANQFMQALGLPGHQQWLRTTQGVFQLIATWIGGPNTRLPDFLVGPSLPLVSVVIYSVWVFSGYNAVIFLAGLGAVPREMIEAAQVDGAGRWSTFRHIIFPLISPTTFFLSVLAIIGTVKAIDHIYVLRDNASRGTMDTAAVYIFRLIREGSAPRSYPAAAAFILFGIILILTLIQERITRDQVFYG